MGPAIEHRAAVAISVCVGAGARGNYAALRLSTMVTVAVGVAYDAARRSCQIVHMVPTVERIVGSTIAIPVRTRANLQHSTALSFCTGRRGARDGSGTCMEKVRVAIAIEPDRVRARASGSACRLICVGAVLFARGNHRGRTGGWCIGLKVQSGERAGARGVTRRLVRGRSLARHDHCRRAGRGVA